MIMLKGFITQIVPMTKSTVVVSVCLIVYYDVLFKMASWGHWPPTF